MARSWTPCAALLVVLACGKGGEEPAPAPASSAGAARVSASAWGPALVQSRDEEGAALKEAERARDPNHPAIASGLASADADRREAAAWSLARIGGEAAVARLLPLLEGPTRPGGAAAAAFGLLEPPRQTPGEPPEPTGIWARLEDALWQRYAVVEDSGHATALLFSIARVGGARSMIRLAADLATRPDREGTGRYAVGMEAVAILCARGFSLTREGVDAVAQGLDVTDPGARRGATYALGRCAAPSAERLAGARGRVLAERIVGLTRGTDDETARLAWKALAALGQTPPGLPDNILGAEPPSWTVEVEAVRALAATDPGRETLAERLVALELGSVTAPRAHAVHEGIRGLRTVAAVRPAVVEPLRSRLQALPAGAQDRADPRAVAIARCELAVVFAIVDGALDGLEGCGAGGDLPPRFEEALAVEALLRMGDGMPREERVAALLQRAESKDPARAVPALSALAEIVDPRVNPVLRRVLTGDDVGLVSAAAGAVAARSVDGQKRDPEAVPVLVAAVKRLPNERAVEARIAAIEALGSLARNTQSDPGTGQDSGAPGWLDEVQALAGDPNAAVRRAAREALLGHPERVLAFASEAITPAVSRPFEAAQEALDASPGAGLRLHTSRGVLEVDFSGAPAPLNQANLAHIARAGTFNGLRFHRVVSGFVVQGGDPRGDGYGGPGWIVPCEWSNLRYERGTVGIALAGKDTGGSQLFITHTPQQHLDGRYTIVGHVTAGLEVLDRLLPHDTIERVEVME